MSTTSKPRVLITAGTTMETENYERAVAGAGGEPVVARPGGDRPDPAAFDALLLPGGADVAPERFGVTVPPELQGVVELEPDRDELEWAALDEAERRGLPVLAICRGLQVLNVYRGGTLHLDLPAAGYTEVRHSRPDKRYEPVHRVSVVESRLRDISGSADLAVNSTHHQAILEAAPDLRVVASAPDGVVEGVESADGRLIAVQWHPERLVAIEEPARRLFADLVARAGAGSPARAQ